ncbi:MAG TPA: TatD family hydrolase [Terriglobales bacterium]|nr:TatD family hydrolase [Terriglobales bacterium]
MSYVDAHIHLADPAYSRKITQIIGDAAQHNVSKVLSNAVDYQTSLQTIRLAKEYPDIVLAAIGVHPSTVTFAADRNFQLEKFEQTIRENAEYVKAIGEIGLDGKYTQDESAKQQQLETFRFFLGLAEKLKLPVVVHSRRAVEETLKTLSEYHLPKVLLHWYDGPAENLRPLKDQEFFISIGPALLYSRRIIEIARATDLAMILTETDGPVPYHGLFESRLTMPSFVIEVLRKLSEIKSMNPEHVRSSVSSQFDRFILHN